MVFTGLSSQFPQAGYSGPTSCLGPTRCFEYCQGHSRLFRFRAGSPPTDCFPSCFVVTPKKQNRVIISLHTRYHYSQLKSRIQLDHETFELAKTQLFRANEHMQVQFNSLLLIWRINETIQFIDKKVFKITNFSTAKLVSDQFIF